MARSGLLPLLLVLALVVACTAAPAKKAAKPAAPKGLMDDSDVLLLNSGNFDKMIKKHRDSKVSIVTFFQSSVADSKAFAPEYLALAKDMKGMVRVGAVDCDLDYALCEKEGQGETFPTVLVYPPNPMPVQKYEGERTAKAMASTVARLIPSQVVKVTATNVDIFLTDKVAMPKCVLFTNKKVTPLLFKALSNDFLNKVIFGEVNGEEEAALAKRFKVKKFPTLLLFTPAKPNEPLEFKGAQISYTALFEFINPYSETFVGGGGYSDKGGNTQSAVATPWLVQPIPELFRPSADDVCFNSNGLCAILLNNGGPLSAPQQELMEGIKERFTAKIARGTKVSFMWLNAAVEPGIVEAFKLSATAMPSFVVLNPGKRKRVAVHSGDMTSEALSSFLDKVLGGDAKFNPVADLTGNTFADRKVQL